MTQPSRTLGSGESTDPGRTSSPTPCVELLEPLGVGRTSRVWRGVLLEPWSADGHDLARGTEVAIKILREDLTWDADARTTLEFEREASRAVHHPSLARTRFLSLGGPTPPLARIRPAEASALTDEELRDAAAPRPWILLDLVPGAALDERPPGDRELPEPVVRSIGASVAQALSALHAAGWIHGDVKPDNVRMDSRGQAILVDLGFARRSGAANAPLGTPEYLAPERAVNLGGPPRASADLFALGVMLYELLTGEHPAGEIQSKPGAAAAAHDAQLLDLRRGQVRPPSDLSPRVSPLMDALVRALLKPGAGSRPTAAEVVSILEEGESSAWWRSRIRFDSGVRRDTVAWSGQHGLPLVGRDEELAVLKRAWERTDEGPIAVWLTGEQGSGKSRIVAEFAHRMRHRGDDPPLYLYARCDPVGDARPGAPLISLLRRWLHLPSPGVPGARSRALLERTVSPDAARALRRTLLPGSDDLPDVDIAESIALAEWLLRLSHSQPTIVFLDDLNFAGRSTLKALTRVARELSAQRMLLILGLRDRSEVRHGPELAELRSRLAPRTERITLGPLDESALLTLVEHTFHHSVPRLRLARTLLARTGGLPGSVGELIRLAKQRGWTRRAPAPGRGLMLLVPPEELPRPEGVRKAVAERLDELGGRCRVWLERLATIGSRIDTDLLNGAWPNANAVKRDAAIADLVRSGWIVPAGNRYRFAHPIDREETLEKMPQHRQRRAHAALGRALARQERERHRRPSYRRAFHLRGAREHTKLLNIVPEILRDLQLGGHPYRRATVAGWGLEAIDEGAEAPNLKRLRRRLLEALADAADRLGEREEQRAALDELSSLEIAEDDDPYGAGRVYLLHARHAVSSGELGVGRGLLHSARRLLQRAEQVSLEPEDTEQLRLDRAEIERLFARVESEHSQFKAASKYASQALQLAPDAVARAEAHLLRAEIEIHDGGLESALKRLSSARRELRAEDGGLRARATRAAISLVSGRAWRLVGRPYRAARAFERAEDLAVRAGEGRIEVEVAARRGRLLADVRREHEAELVLRDALFTARRIEDRRGEALAALFLGILLGETGEASASSLVRRATALSRSLGQGRIEALAAAIEARIAFGGSDLQAALERSAHGWDLVDAHGAELCDRIVIGGTRALTLDLAGENAAAERIQRTLRRRLESDNARLSSTIMRQRHRRWTVALLASSLDTDGPLYPRVMIEDP